MREKKRKERMGYLFENMEKMDKKLHQSTSRVLDILELLARNNAEGMRFSEISRELDMPKGSLHPLLHTLVARKYVIYNSGNEKYYLGEVLFHLGNKYTQRSSLLDQIRKIMVKISEENNVTSFFGVLSYNQVLYLLRENAPGGIQIVATPGYKVPANCTAIGKSLLSGFGYEELHEFFKDGLPKLTDKSVTDPDILYEQIKEIDEKGLSYEREESSPYTRCIATPITYEGKCIAAMSAAFPNVEIEEKQLLKLETRLRKARVEIETIISNNIENWIYSEI